jgi:ribosomal protein L11 methyltransferase
MEASWLEVSVTVDGELAEAVAEVLARYIPNGVVVESTAGTFEEYEREGRLVGLLRVSGYLPADEQVDEMRQQIEQALWYLGRIRPLPAPQFEPVEEVDWSEAWKEHYQPLPIGQRLVIVPAWMEPPKPGRIPVSIDPGMAFGTGTHPTTQLCLEIVDESLSGKYARTGRKGAVEVIDVGCGSGILSIAALKLGAGFALGVDVDPQAVSAARENAIRNNLAGRLDFQVGSVYDILSGAFSLQQAPLVLANILASTLLRLLDEGLGRLTLPGGDLVLSGILDEQTSGVEAALQKHGLRVTSRRRMGDWAALVASGG